MKTITTFNDEKIFFEKHIPGNITNQCKNRFQNNLPDDFLTQLYGSPVTEDVNLSLEEFDIKSIWPIRQVEILDDIQPIGLFLEMDHELQFELANVIANFGRDAFGLYLPYHYYKDCWGIYLFEEIIDKRVHFLHSIFEDKISFIALKKFYYYAVYRHELFHYQVERFATKLELVTKQKVYRNSRILFQKVRNSEDWLEEALAESSVLKSILIPKRTSIKPKLMNEIYVRDLQDMPPGYRDYHCNKFKGEKEAHKLFASQFIENVLNPTAKVTGLVSIKDEFITLDKNVPTYKVTGFNNVKRIVL